MLDNIKRSWQTDEQLKLEIQRILDGSKSKYTWKQCMLLRKGKLVVRMDRGLCQRIIHTFHSSSTAGHSEVHVTTKRIAGFCYWKELERDVRTYIRRCDTCQRCKYDQSSYSGLLQPLLIPTVVWARISIDFIEGLSLSKGKGVVIVVVDCLTKCAHFIALGHPFTIAMVADAFMQNNFRLHGLPRVIVNDRDTIFFSKFWQTFFKLQGVYLHMSTAYHPHTDGQTEVVKRCLETYLRCTTSDCPSKWRSWLALTEWWYNTSFHSSIHMSFEALYG